jgi:hypothetical protein
MENTHAVSSEFAAVLQNREQQRDYILRALTAAAIVLAAYHVTSKIDPTHESQNIGS